MAPDGFHPSVVFAQPTNPPINQRVSVYSFLRFLKSPTSIATKHTYHFKWLREKHSLKRMFFTNNGDMLHHHPPQKKKMEKIFQPPTTSIVLQDPAQQFSCNFPWWFFGSQLPTKLFSTGNEESRRLGFFSMFKTPGYPQKSHWKSAILKNSEEWQASPVQNPSRFLQMCHNNWLMYPLGN